MNIREIDQKENFDFFEKIHTEDGIKWLKLLRSKVTPQLITAMLNYLRWHPGITGIDISCPAYESRENYEWFTSEGLKLIGSLTNLTHLRLFESYITSKSLSSLCQNAENSSIQFLSLDSNDIKNPEPLQALPQLSVLFMRCNHHLTTAGLSALSTFPALKKLNIETCPIDDAGLKELAACPLTSLSIDTSDLPLMHDSMEIFLNDASVANKTLIEFNDFGEIGDHYKERIKEMLTRNRQCTDNIPNSLPVKKTTIDFSFNPDNKARSFLYWRSDTRPPEQIFKTAFNAMCTPPDEFWEESIRTGADPVLCDAKQSSCVCLTTHFYSAGLFPIKRETDHLANTLYFYAIALPRPHKIKHPSKELYEGQSDIPYDSKEMVIDLHSYQTELAAKQTKEYEEMDSVLTVSNQAVFQAQLLYAYEAIAYSVNAYSTEDCHQVQSKVAT